VNLLVQVLRENAYALPDLDPSEDAPYRQLAEVAAAKERLGRLLRAADVDPLISEVLSSSFAGVVRIDEWDEARETGLAEQAEPGAHREWVTMIPIPGRQYGVTLPDDRFRTQCVSLFTRAGGPVRRVSVVVIPDKRPTLELRMAGGECGFPYRGVCDGGTCRDCRQDWIAHPGQPAGYACSCEDDVPGGLAARGAAHAGLLNVLVERLADARSESA
jgi:hypothetical protein